MAHGMEMFQVLIHNTIHNTLCMYYFDYMAEIKITWGKL